MTDKPTALMRRYIHSPALGKLAPKPPALPTWIRHAHKQREETRRLERVELLAPGFVEEVELVAAVVERQRVQRQLAARLPLRLRKLGELDLLLGEGGFCV